MSDLLFEASVEGRGKAIAFKTPKGVQVNFLDPDGTLIRMESYAGSRPIEEIREDVERELNSRSFLTE